MLLHLKSLLLPAVREGDKEDDDDEHDDGDERPQDHGEALPPLHLVLDLGLGQELDRLQKCYDERDLLTWILPLQEAYTCGTF